MKKTLVALAVAAFASSASAVTLYEADGSKVEFDGSLRMVLDEAKQSKHTIDSTTNTITRTDKHAHAGIRNAGSRFAVRAKHQIADDFYALGRLEFRFDDKRNGVAESDGFGALYTKRAYVGLGSKQYGELTFGRQLTVIDDLSQSTDYNYGINPKGAYAETAGNQVVRYDYRGVENLQLSANYNFGADRLDNEVKVDSVQNAYGVGALYTVNNWDLRAAYGHTNYKTELGSESHRKNAALGSVGYTFGDLKLSFDAGYYHENDEGAKGNAFYVSPNFALKVSPKSKVYGNYVYERNSVKDDSKSKSHGFLLGADYQFHKQVVAFVEGKYVRNKGYDYNETTGGYTYSAKTTDKAIGVGMRVFW